MSTGIEARPRSFGVAGSLAGLLALIAVLLPPLLVPMFAAAPQTEIAAPGKSHSLKERVLEKLKLAPAQKQVPKPALGGWAQYFPPAAIALALFAIALAVGAVIRREEKIYAGVAAALGIGALAFQLAILFAGAAIAILVLYVVLNQSDGSFLQPGNHRWRGPRPCRRRNTRLRTGFALAGTAGDCRGRRDPGAILIA